MPHQLSPILLSNRGLKGAAAAQCSLWTPQCGLRMTLFSEPLEREGETTHHALCQSPPRSGP